MILENKFTATSIKPTLDFLWHTSFRTKSRQERHKVLEIQSIRHLKQPLAETHKAIAAKVKQWGVQKPK